jgi:hypothetical protein
LHPIPPLFCGRLNHSNKYCGPRQRLGEVQGVVATPTILEMLLFGSCNIPTSFLLAYCMNQTFITDKLSVLAKLTAILTIALSIVACDNKENPPTPPPAVLKSIKGSIEKPVENLVIKGITDSGLVYLGKPGQSLKDTVYSYQYMRRKPDMLEGKALVGDRAIVVLYYEDQLLANGAVRRVIVKRVVRSVNNQAIENYFNGLKGE